MIQAKNAIVYGGGPAGLATAYLLAKEKIFRKVEVYDRFKKTEAPGLAVTYKTELSDRERYLENLFAGMQKKKVTTFRGIDRENGIPKDSEKFGPVWSFPRAAFVSGLRELCEAEGVHIHYGTHFGEKEVRKSNADLIVGADGQNSVVREVIRPHVGYNEFPGSNNLIWLGSTKKTDSFSAIFAHESNGTAVCTEYAAPEFNSAIFEIPDDIFKGLNLGRNTTRAGKITDKGLRKLENLFNFYYDKGDLFSANSIWGHPKVYYTDKNHHGNVALVGESSVGAYYYTGAGMQFAVLSAYCLADALKENDTVEAALEEYQGVQNGMIPKTEGWISSLRQMESLNFISHLAPTLLFDHIVTPSREEQDVVSLDLEDLLKLLVGGDDVEFIVL